MISCVLDKSLEFFWYVFDSFSSSNIGKDFLNFPLQFYFFVVYCTRQIEGANILLYIPLAIVNQFYTLFNTFLSFYTIIMETTKTTKLETIKNIIKEQEKDYEFNDYITNYVSDEDIEACESVDDVKELLEKANENYEITDTEVIYYASAIAYLQENDPSLRESLGIASECGYETDKLNSEVLASLLQSRNNQEDYADFIDNVISELERAELF